MGSGEEREAGGQTPGTRSGREAVWSITVHVPSGTGFSGGRCRRVTSEPSKEEEQSPIAHSGHRGPGRLPDCLLSGWAGGMGASGPPPPHSQFWLFLCVTKAKEQRKTPRSQPIPLKDQADPSP